MNFFLLNDFSVRPVATKEKSVERKRPVQRSERKKERKERKKEREKREKERLNVRGSSWK
jgi:hypothetical protein